MILKFLKKLTVPAILYGGLLVFLFSTNPSKLSIGWLLLPFVWLFIALFWTYLKILKKTKMGRKRKRTLLIAVFGAALPTLGLLLDSINQLTIRDGLLLLTFGAVGFFYASRINFGRQT